MRWMYSNNFVANTEEEFIKTEDRFKKNMPTLMSLTAMAKVPNKLLMEGSSQGRRLGIASNLK